MAKTVLIVDDEPAIRQVLSFTLSGEGYELFEAADADAALAVIEQARPDLILLDWMLPGLSGLDLARCYAATTSCLKAELTEAHLIAPQRKTGITALMHFAKFGSFRL